MLEDKLRETDWELTQETIEEQVARESYLQWLKDQEKYGKMSKASVSWVRLTVTVFLIVYCEILKFIESHFGIILYIWWFVGKSDPLVLRTWNFCSIQVA